VHRGRSDPTLVARHPAYAVVPPSSPPGDAVLQRFGPQQGEQLRELLEEEMELFPVEPTN
jgi:hypothetical protein